MIGTDGLQHVTVFDESTNAVLEGDQAPTQEQVDNWILQHPGWKIKLRTLDECRDELSKEEIEELEKQQDEDGNYTSYPRTFKFFYYFHIFEIFYALWKHAESHLNSWRSSLAA